jgi:hypothetical protein
MMLYFYAYALHLGGCKRVLYITVMILQGYPQEVAEQEYQDYQEAQRALAAQEQQGEEVLEVLVELGGQWKRFVVPFFSSLAS